MKFNPKTEKEIQEANLIPEKTICPVKILNAIDKTSAAGNEMIELTVRVFHGDKSFQVLDWIMPKVEFKFFHFCAYMGLSKQYETGTLTAADCKDREGYAKIGIQSDKTGQYPDRNNIMDYVRMPVGKPGSAAPKVDEDILF